MTTWQAIGIDNFRVAVSLYDTGQYRSAASRFYYSVFSILTHELILRKAAADFRNVRSTPGHSQLPRLLETYFTQLSPDRRKHLIGFVVGLYRDRLIADYSLSRVDKLSAKETYRAAEKIFRYLGVGHE